MGCRLSEASDNLRVRVLLRARNFREGNIRWLGIIHDMGICLA